MHSAGKQRGAPITLGLTEEGDIKEQKQAHCHLCLRAPDLNLSEVEGAVLTFLKLLQRCT